MRMIIGDPKRFVPGLVALSGICLLAWTYLPRYWEMQPPTGIENLKQGETADGYPWIGAENPEITISEFSDYMCFQCKKMHFYLRQLVAQQPQRIRLVHRHFPMDRAYNPLVTDDYHAGAGKMAILALYAQEKGQFWKVNDRLFEIASQKADFNTRTLAIFMDVDKAEVVAALDHKYFRLRLKHDIAVGIDMGINGTPGFIIDDQVYVGNIPQEVLQQIVNDNEKQ
jgi:protein-disulfide isomerase